VAWSSKQSKMLQPDLDYVCPEIQLQCAAASASSDVFSFGQLVCALFTETGKSLIQAEYNVSIYTRQMDKVRPTHARTHAS